MILKDLSKLTYYSYVCSSGQTASYRLEGAGMNKGLVKSEALRIHCEVYLFSENVHND